MRELLEILRIGFNAKDLIAACSIASFIVALVAWAEIAKAIASGA